MCCSSNSHRTSPHIGQTSILLSLVMLPMKCYGFVTKEAVKVLKGSYSEVRQDNPAVTA
jgi:hypothetical protein